MRALLTAIGVRPRSLQACPDTLVVGNAWDDVAESSLSAFIRLHRDNRVRLMSQEFWLLDVLFADSPTWWNPRSSTIRPFVEASDLLTHLDGAWIGWVHTGIRPLGARNTTGYGEAESPLKQMDYTVGASGHPQAWRRALLREAFTGTGRALQATFDDSWGRPRTAARLQRIAKLLASNVRNAKRKRSAAMDEAIAEWEEDLRWLKDTFYTLSCQFSWPGSDMWE